MHMFGEYGAGMGGLGMIFMALFWVLIIVGVIYLIKLLADKGRSGAQTESAEEILKKRYAKDEISLRVRKDQKRAVKMISKRSLIPNPPCLRISPEVCYDVPAI
ncbi:MAG: hypothetical protein ABFS18_08065 [Thermodesulfobacteriota bacterium]